MTMLSSAATIQPTKKQTNFVFIILTTIRAPVGFFQGGARASGRMPRGVGCGKCPFPTGDRVLGGLCLSPENFAIRPITVKMDKMVNFGAFWAALCNCTACAFHDSNLQ